MRPMNYLVRNSFVYALLGDVMVAYPVVRGEVNWNDPVTIEPGQEGLRAAARHSLLWMRQVLVTLNQGPGAQVEHERAWVVFAPDGRQWAGESPLKACAAAQRDTIDPVLAMQRLNAMVDEENAIRDKELAEAYAKGREDVLKEKP